MDEAKRLRAIDRTWLLGDDPHIPSAPATLVAAIAKGEMSKADQPQRIFDLALALQYAGDWETSDRVLAFLDETDYHPIRQTVAVDSVSYYRALAALHQDHPREAEALLRQAAREAPADSSILALRFLLLKDAEARRLLFLVHDRLTADLALARAHYEMGNMNDALSIASRLSNEIPEWNRANLFAAYLSDLQASYGAAGPRRADSRGPAPSSSP